MYKRLIGAFLIVGAVTATMVMGASAFWTTGNINVNVNATSGSADLSLDEVPGCDTELPANGCDVPVPLSSIVPGWSESSPWTFTNTGDVDLKIILKTNTFGGSGALLNALVLDIACTGGAPGSAAPTNSAYTAGYQIATVAAGQSVTCNGELSLPNTSSNQNNLQNQNATFTITFFGTTE